MYKCGQRSATLHPELTVLRARTSTSDSVLADQALKSLVCDGQEVSEASDFSMPSLQMQNSSYMWSQLYRRGIYDKKVRVSYCLVAAHCIQRFNHNVLSMGTAMLFLVDTCKVRLMLVSMQAIQSTVADQTGTSTISRNEVIMTDENTKLR